MLKKGTGILIAAYFLLLFLFYQMFIMSATWNSDMAKNVSLTGETAPQSSQNSVNQQVTIEYVIVSGTGGDPVVNTCEQTFRLLKKGYTTIDSLVDIRENYQDAKVMLIATDQIDSIGDLGLLEQALSDGVQVVFCRMPDTDTASFSQIQQLIGVREYGKRFEKKGICFYQGVLLDGIQRFEELTVATQDIALLGTCRVYASGYDKDVFDYDNVPLIWRTYYDGAPLCVVNGDFLENYNGIGILTGLLSQIQGTFIYPVVNARVAMVEGFPVLSNEYDAYFNQNYNRSFSNFSRDIIWADMISLFRGLDMRATFYYTPYRDPAYRDGPFDTDVLDFYSKEFSLNNFEIGISRPDDPERPAQETVNQAMEILSGKLTNYQVYTANTDYFGEYESSNIDITSVPVTIDGTEENAGVYFIADDVITMPVITKGINFGEEALYQNICFGSALGYVSYCLDFNAFFEDPDFNKLYLDFSKETYKTMTRLIYPFRNLDDMTVSEAAVRMKNYLSFTPVMEETEDYITISTGSSEITYFILKTIKTIEDTENVEISKLENNTYMLKVGEPEARITFKKED